MQKDSLFYEKLSFNTHPCLEEELYDGWLLRFAEGYTKRANSVNIVGESGVLFADKVSYCEAAYAKHNLPTVFKIAPMAAELDGVLEDKGYSAVDKTNVMTVDLTRKGKIQARIANPVLCATVYADKKAVACGLGVMEQGHVGLLDIVVKEEYRGCGFGKVLCQALLEKAKEKGATTGYLQVVDGNIAAKKLYKSLGFEDLYSYWYRVKY